MLKDDGLLLDISTAGTPGCEERMQQLRGKKMRKRLNDREAPFAQCYDQKST